MNDTTTYDPLRELAYRENHGLEVTLLWDERSDRLVVSVHDTKNDDFFVLNAARDKALDVFYHPFSYAASRRPRRKARSYVRSQCGLDVANIATVPASHHESCR